MYDETKHNELTITCTALSTVHILLQTGLFQGSSSTELVKSINFIASLHAQAFEQLEPLIELKAASDAASVVPTDV